MLETLILGGKFVSFKKQPRQNEQEVSPYRWVVWGILVSIYLIVFFHRLSVGVITGDLDKSFGMNATQIANLGAMYFYAYTVMQIPTGILVDHLGPKKTAIAGCIVAAFGSIIFALSINIPMAYLGRLLVGLGVSVIFLCVLKIQSNWFPAEKFASMSGLTTFIGSMGGLLAQTPLVLVVGLIGWRNAFLSMGIITILLSVLVIRFVKNTPSEIGLPEVNPEPVQTLEERQSILSQLSEIVRNTKIWGPAFVFGGINGGFMLFTGTFGVSYITVVYDLSKTSAANLVSIALLASGIACLLVGRISDKLKRRKLPMIVISAIAVLAWGVLVFLKPPVWLMVISILLIGSTSSVGVVCWSLGKEVSNSKLSGMAMSIVNGCGFIFAALLMVMCGKLIDINIANGLSPDVAYPKAFIVAVVSSVISLIFALLSTESRCKNIYTK